MTKDEVLDQYDATFGGMLLDSWAQNRTGEAQVLFCRRIMSTVRVLHSRLFDDAQRIAKEDQAKVHRPLTKPDKGLFGAAKKSKVSDGE